MTVWQRQKGLMTSLEQWHIIKASKWPERLSFRLVSSPYTFDVGKQPRSFSLGSSIKQVQAGCLGWREQLSLGRGCGYLSLWTHLWASENSAWHFSCLLSRPCTPDHDLGIHDLEAMDGISARVLLQCIRCSVWCGSCVWCCVVQDHKFIRFSVGWLGWQRLKRLSLRCYHYFILPRLIVRTDIIPLYFVFLWEDLLYFQATSVTLKQPH